MLGVTGDSGASDTGATSYDFCAAMKTRADSCKATFDSAACNKTKACVDGAIRAEVRTALEQCLSSNPCSTNSSDACLASVAQPYENVSPFSDYATKCAAKRQTCGTWPEDYCATKYAVATPDVTSKMSACMDLACDGIPTCFSDVLASYTCNN